MSKYYQLFPGGPVMSHSPLSRTLSLLRREKGVSQRSAAATLGISQALLSHYENGAREPGFAFLCRACDYYGVTSDYLLGRTMQRGDDTIRPEELYDASAERDNRVSGVGVLSTLNKRLVINAVTLLYELSAKTGSKALVREMSACLASTVYRLFRQFYEVCGAEPARFFPVPAAAFPSLSEADRHLSEARWLALLSGSQDDEDAAPKLSPLSHDALGAEYPLLIQSMLTLTHAAEQRMQGLYKP
jgi:transcriptional regulator with XRE-family HTH domain